MERIKRVEFLANLLDAKFSVLGFRFGLDGIIGLIPGIGDILTGLISFYIVWEGYRLGCSKFMLLRMLSNILIEVVIGSIPILGDFFDFVWKANLKNLHIIKSHHERSQSHR